MDFDEPSNPSSDLRDPPFVMRRTAAPPSRTPEQVLRKANVRGELFPDAPPAPSPSFGRYRLKKKLGEGGMGTVFEAHDPQLDRRVALKLLQIEPGTDNNPARFRREGQALARVSHPNVVQVFEAGEVDERPFVAMELVTGQSLDKWQARVPRPGWRRCVEVYLDAGHGLAAVHAADLIHRDFKPSNCMIDDRGCTRVLDFGLVALRNDRHDPHAPNEAGASTDLNDALGVPLTRTGTQPGTLAYMSLEQLHQRPVDTRSDQFSFCVSLYEAIYGHRPFAGTTQTALMLAQEERRLAPVSRHIKVPRRLRRALLRGLQNDPRQRWPSMDALLDELELIHAPWLGTRAKATLSAFGVGIALAGWTGFSPPCTESAQQLEGVWNDTRRAEVERVFATSTLPHAGRTWAVIEPQLQAYTKAWVTRHTDSCEATHVYKTQPEEDMGRRMSCLSSSRIALQETVAALTRPGESTVNNAVTLVSKLPRLSRCDDIEALRLDIPPPEDEQTARQVEELRAQLARLQVMHDTGDLAEVAQQLDEEVGKAEALHYPPVLAEALWQRGELRDELGRHDAAFHDLERAHNLATKHEHRSIETLTASALTWVIGRQKGEHERGREWGTRALNLAERRNIDPEIEAGALGNIGMMLYRTGELHEAEELLLRALEIKESITGTIDPSVATTLEALGHVHLAQGHAERALDRYRSALTIRKALMGVHHPETAETAKSLGNIGNVLASRGRHDEALEHYERALEIQQEVLDPGHVDLARTLGNIGNLLQSTGDLDAALEYHRRALVIWKRDAPQSLELAYTFGNIAIALQSTGALDGALTHHDRALDIFETKAPRSPLVAQTLDNMAFVLRDLDRVDEALDHQRRALTIYEQTLGAEHPSVANMLANIGDTLLRRGDPDRARDPALRSIELYEQTLGVEHDDLAYPRLVLAKIDAAMGDHSHATALAQQVLAMCGEDSTCSHLRADAQLLSRADATPPTESAATEPD